MRDSLIGGVYTLHRGGHLNSLVHLPLLDHGALTTAEAAVSPTGELPDPPLPGAVEYPLPIDW